MHGIPSVDQGRKVDWSKTSTDYAQHRPGPPAKLYDVLALLDVGLPSQRMLDLGTGTGLLAREFARRGAIVSGTDIAAGQIEQARQLALKENLKVDFRVAPAERCPFDDRSFHVVTASQCWLYFDVDAATAEVKRVLKPGGVLVTTHFSWLPRLDPVARASEQLVLKFNPQWTGKDWAGVIPSVPEWSCDHFEVAGMFWFDVAVPFTRESWRGRIRACRGVGAALELADVERFDAEHALLLERLVPDQFTILHRVDAHVFRVPRVTG